MIPIEALRAVKRVVVHANCPDGRASALILHAALPDAHICEMAYNSPEHDNLAATPGLLFCDFTPPKHRLAEFVAAGTIVLDHHTRDLVEPFGPLGVFGENEKLESGAMLAYLLVYCTILGAPPMADGKACAAIAGASRLATLAAVRDTWKRTNPLWDEACAQSEALRFVPLADLLKMGIGRFVDLARDLGPLLLKKNRDAATLDAKNALRMVISGRSVAIVSLNQNSGSISDIADAITDADIIVGFFYVHENGSPRLVVSLRSRGDVDVQRIARRFAGNGHKPAAGFSVPVGDMRIGDPYLYLETSLSAALEA